MELLDQHKKEFAGISWMPKNFFQRKRIVFILTRMESLYESFEKIDFTGMPGEAMLVKSRYQMWLDLTLAKRWQVRDHLRFFHHINAVLLESRNILERLRRLAITGQIYRTTTPKADAPQDASLLD